MTAVAQGGAYLLGRDDPTLWARAAGLLLVACGASLLVGLLTPFACIVIGLYSAGAALSALQATAPHLFAAGLSLLIEVGAVAALVLTGPGAFSLDARLFGRREIIISQPPRTLQP